MKLKILEYLALVNPINNYEFSLITNYYEIRDLYDSNRKNFTKIIYYIMNSIHNLLYEFEEMINIQNEEIHLNYLYYLILLIQDNTNIVNYTYSLDFIKIINNLNNNKSNLRKIIISLIIVALINNYKNFSEEDNRQKQIYINSIEISNINFIENNSKILKEYKINLNDYKFYKIDYIYGQIIKQIILNHDFEDYQNIYDIIKDLDLENISINKYLFDELHKILDNNIINDKQIKNKEDFNKKYIINFYYILLKYILKNPVFIYNIRFLWDSRKKIIQIIKSPDKIILNNNKDFIEYKERLYFIIKTLTDSEYYYYIFVNKVISDIKKEDNFKSKDKKRDPYNDNIKQNKIFNDNSQLAQTTTTANTINEIITKNIIDYENSSIKNSFDFNYSLIKFKDEDNNLNKIIEKDNYFERKYLFMNLKKIVKFINNLNGILQRDFGSNFNSHKDLEINLHFTIENHKKTNNIYNITCIYCLKKLNTKYKDENILINGLSDGFQALLCDIQYELIN